MRKRNYIAVLACLLVVACILVGCDAKNLENPTQGTSTTEKPVGSVTDSRPTAPGNSAPSDPTTPSRPEDVMTYDRYNSLPAEEQAAFRKNFDSMAEFFEWLKVAKEAYEAENPDVELGDGFIDLEDIMNGTGK